MNNTTKSTNNLSDLIMDFEQLENFMLYLYPKIYNGLYQYGSSNNSMSVVNNHMKYETSESYMSEQSAPTSTDFYRNNTSEIYMGEDENEFDNSNDLGVILNKYLNDSISSYLDISVNESNNVTVVKKDISKIEAHKIMLDMGSAECTKCIH